MSEKKTSWILELVDKITAPLRGVQSGADKTAAAFENANKNAEKQGCKSVVMNIDNFDGEISYLPDKIKSGFIFGGKPINKKVQKILIIKGKNVVSLTRKQVEKGLFNDLEKFK